MLITTMEIKFFCPDQFSTKDGICATTVLRPSFNFTNDLLFSGTIVNNVSIEKYIYDKNYTVRVDFPTIDNEAYEAIKPLIKTGMILNIQIGAKIIGIANLIDYTY